MEMNNARSHQLEKWWGVVVWFLHGGAEWAGSETAEHYDAMEFWKEIEEKQKGRPGYISDGEVEQWGEREREMVARRERVKGVMWVEYYGLLLVYGTKAKRQ